MVESAITTLDSSGLHTHEGFTGNNAAYKHWEQLHNLLFTVFTPNKSCIELLLMQTQHFLLLLLHIKSISTGKTWRDFYCESATFSNFCVGVLEQEAADTVSRCYRSYIGVTGDRQHMSSSSARLPTPFTVSCWCVERYLQHYMCSSKSDCGCMM